MTKLKKILSAITNDDRYFTLMGAMLLLYSTLSYIEDKPIESVISFGIGMMCQGIHSVLLQMRGDTDD
jgi:hypothetical protein